MTIKEVIHWFRKKLKKNPSFRRWVYRSRVIDPDLRQATHHQTFCFPRFFRLWLVTLPPKIDIHFSTEVSHSISLPSFDFADHRPCWRSTQGITLLEVAKGTQSAKMAHKEKAVKGFRPVTLNLIGLQKFVKWSFFTRRKKMTSVLSCCSFVYISYLHNGQC